jgi:glycosyltransferase involved in cell wall biosynthesis
MLREIPFDIVTAEFSKMGYLRLPATVRTVLDEHNTEYDILRRTFKSEHGIRKLYAYLNYLKLRREERAMWRAFDGCAVTSERDERLLLQDSPGSETSVVPNAVDTDYFAPMGDGDPMTIAFFGANHYFPNIDGIQYFMREIMPLVKRRHPGARLLIIGYSPEALYSWAGDDVILTGIVDDIRDYLARANVIIAPLRIGGGTRFKILEAMAMGKAVVSTTIGAEGLAVTHGQDVLLADTPEDFASQVNRLLDDQALSRRIGQAGRQLVERRYDWQAAVGELERLYSRLLGAPVGVG